jgi:BirA family transcriptional regulator, biotin operon repressor / biotin---[acetyl-CoA-carboxylase] ligase
MGLWDDVIVLPSVGSTNDHAAELLRCGKISRATIVLARKQTAGVGRDGSAWWSDSGSMTATFVAPRNASLLAMRAATAVLLACRAVLPREVRGFTRIKWPNDVLIRGRKVAGILCRRVAGFDVVGVGINVNSNLRRAPATVRREATSLALAAEREIDITKLLTRLAGELGKSMLRDPPTPSARVLHVYRTADALVGTQVQVLLPQGRNISGTALGVDETGRLLVRTAAGNVKTVVTGSIRPLRRIGASPAGRSTGSPRRDIVA